jgi:hypothetical protein
LIILGWSIVSRQHTSRLIRSEFKEVIGECCEDLREIEASSAKYWAIPGNASEAEGIASLIRGRLQTLALKVGRIDKKDKRKAAERQLTTAMKDLRQAATMAPFDSKDRKPCSGDGDRLRTIYSASQALETELTHVASTLYPL